jgi:hypothetical protein
MYRALFIRYALFIAGLGVPQAWLMKYCRTRAEPPARAGVEWLVPEDVEYHCWPIGKKLAGSPGSPALFVGRAHTPSAVKLGDVPFGNRLLAGSAMFCHTAPVT